MIGEDSKPQENEIIEELRDDEDLDLESFGEQLTDDLLEASDSAPSKDKSQDQATTDSSQISDLIAQILALKQQAEEKEGQYKRLFADFDNFRKRTEREKEEEEAKISAKILKKILPVVDDFERAQLQLKPKTDGETSIHNSYQSVYKQLVKSLKEAGVTKMRPLHEQFDPNFHEAIAQETTNEYEEGTVIDELRSGYLLGERILRHALVRVSTPLTEDSITEKDSDHISSEN
ncbi:molecular chaperone GrpE (heat shock protein) [Synechococcus sp. PCC 7502]|uniref:nucleotide exchange factor GrpE n=1 Tax=Synechococcus sp. PCC 7502 TaxID=1173263 RepID=UPI00029FDB06|nr:nucleotide exchange factor GrpE [Synechococcus sp. PCC 7502]AFY74862.1 molecular chaperone GrpE (heat shock protein) [Synechococcus sp. PCC 7502]